MQLHIVNSLVQNLVIGCGWPISLAENEYFIAFMHDVHPKFSIPSRSHITQKLIPAMKDNKITHMTKFCLKQSTLV